MAQWKQIPSAAYGGSQATGWVGAAAAGLYHSHRNTESEPRLWPTPQLTVTPDPCCWVRPGIEPISSWVLVGFINCWAMTGIPSLFFFLSLFSFLFFSLSLTRAHVCFCCSHGMQVFLGQGRDWPTANLGQSSDNTGSLIHWTKLLQINLPNEFFLSGFRVGLQKPLF